MYKIITITLQSQLRTSWVITEAIDRILTETKQKNMINTNNYSETT